MAAKKHGWQAMLYDPQNPETSSQKVAEALRLSI
jgi:hypothetical protein